MAENINPNLKRKLILSTNINSPPIKRILEMRPNARFLQFIELYEEIFDIDLYGYKLKFIETDTRKEVFTFGDCNLMNG